MKILEELYYGNITPSEKAIKRGSEYETLLSSLCKNDEVFNIVELLCFIPYNII